MDQILMEKKAPRSTDDIITQPCVGCGFCCLKTPCGASLRIHGTTDVCPELNWNGSRYECKLMTRPGQIGERYRKELYAGAGCCAGLNSWRKEVKERDPKEANRPKYTPKTPEIPPMMQLFLATLGRQFVSGDMIELTCLGWEEQLLKEGYSADDADALKNLALHYIRANRSRFTEDFMG
jgi:hypothetical protein